MWFIIAADEEVSVGENILLIDRREHVILVRKKDRRCCKIERMFGIFDSNEAM